MLGSTKLHLCNRYYRFHGDMILKNFALIGVGGYIAPRHLKAIHDTGNRLVAAIDPNDSVGVLDKYFPEAKFFTEIERFDRFLEKHRRQASENKVDYVSICSPNYLHDAHVRLGLRLGAHVICEKPLVLSPWNVDALGELEQESGRRVFNVLQLRLLPSLQQLLEQILQEKSSTHKEVHLSYVTSRGPWYHVSWKGDPQKSGGIAMNIGIHFFDLLLWLFGSASGLELHLNDPNRMAGSLQLERARVSWFLSTDKADLPESYRRDGKPAFRSITVDGQELEFSAGFTDLHTSIYKDVLDGRGFGLSDVRPSIDLVHAIRTAKVVSARTVHPLAKPHL